MSAVLFATVVLSMLAVGSVHVLALLAVCPLGFAAGALALALGKRRTFPAPAVLIALLAAYTLLQALPLPLPLVSSLSFRNGEIWRRALSLLGEHAPWVSLSLDPGASLVEALKWGCYAAVFVAAAVLGEERGASRVLGMVFGSAFIATVVTIGHRLVHAQSLFGIYRPVFASPTFALAPLLNPNNLAGYLNLGAFAGLGLFFERKPALPRWVLGIGIAAVIGLSAVCGSRAGFTALVLGAIGLSIALWRLRFRGLHGLIRIQGVIVAAGFVLFLLGADRGVWSSLFEEGMKKFALFSWTRPLIAQHFLLGIGRGSFESVFPAYRVDTGNHLYQFAENFVMQWCAEWGVPLAITALLAFAVLLNPRRLGVTRSPVALCGAIGVAVLLLQNLLDLALEVGSVSIALFAVLGGLWGAERASRHPVRPVEAVAQPRAVPFAAFVILGFGASLFVAVSLWGTSTAIHDRAELSEVFRRAQHGSEEDTLGLRSLAAQAIRRHPGDSFLALIGAVAYSESGVPSVAWVARAIDRDPMSARPYLLLAELFAAHKKTDQVMLSVRMAAERDYALIPSAIRIALAFARNSSDLDEAIPDGKPGAMFLAILATNPALTGHRTAFLEEAIARDPDMERPRALLADDLVSALEQGREPCLSASADCVRQVVEQGHALARIDPTSAAPVILTARILMAQKRPREAQKLLSSRCSAFGSSAPCMRWLVTAALRCADPAVLREATAAFLSASCLNAEECASAATWLAAKYNEFGDFAMALQMYQRAANESGSPQAWQRVANAAKQLGLNSLADTALRRGGLQDATVTQELERSRLNAVLGAASQAP